MIGMSFMILCLWDYNKTPMKSLKEPHYNGALTCATQHILLITAVINQVLIIYSCLNFIIIQEWRPYWLFSPCMRDLNEI